METLSAYQQMRRANLNENMEFLMQYGLQAPVVESTSVTKVGDEEKKHKSASKRVKTTQQAKQKIPDEQRRTSFRVRLKVQNGFFEDYDSLKDSDEDEEQEELLKKNLSLPNRNIARPPRPNSYGSIEGVKVGTWWETRLDCNYDYIHRPTVAGIHQGPDGAYSVALSGGYEDDVDLGDFFTYTGEGGRDLKGTVSNPKNLRTAPQSKHQTLTRGNLALSRNVETGNPVRVIRGYKLRSKFAPERGYRYDGLYNVTKFWEAVGKAGYKIFKYEFTRCDPEPAPWHKKTDSPRKEKDDTCNDTPTKGPLTCSSNSKKAPRNTLLNDSRKTLYFELTPGKKSPVKVAYALECLGSLSVTCEDLGWRGWSLEYHLPKTSCFTIKYEDEAEQVCLDGDKWCLVSDLPPEQCAPPTVTCDKENTLAAEDHCLINSSKGYSHRLSGAPTNEGWCGWSKESVINCDYLTVDYEGCVVRVGEKAGSWQEVYGTDTSALCEQGSRNISNHEVDVDLNLESCDWPGWPEGEFSVLHCPSTFNCVLSNKI